MSETQKKRRKGRVHSSIDSLPEPVRQQLDLKLSRKLETFIELSDWLKSEGYEISKSAIGRYSMRTREAADRVVETLRHTQMIAQAVSEHPDLDYTKAAEIVLVDGLMQRVSTAEDEFLEMPLDKAGRLLASLARNATYERRVRAELKKIGAPEDLVQCLGTENEPDIELTNELTSVLMEESDMIIATGGAGMVKAAYSSGTPCYGVGQGNVQVLVDEGFTDFDTIAANVLASRTNDAGTNCTGEQTIYVPKDQKENLIKAFEAKGCFCVRDSASVDKLRNGIFPGGGPINRDVPGKQPKDALAAVGVEIPECPIALVDLESFGPSEQLAREILFPLVRINSYEDFEDALTQAKANLLFEGAGHSSSIYSHNDERILHAGMVLPVCRLSVKMPNVMVTGATNSNGMPPTITIGCGTWGGNSGSDNLNYTHLLNKTRIIRRIENAVDKAIDDIFKD